MISLDELINDEQIKEEYKKAVLLSLFKKVISREKADEKYKNHVENLFKQSYNRENTIKKIFLNDFGCEIDEDDARILNEWFLANQRKEPIRRHISWELKVELCKKQGNVCLACGRFLGEDYSKIHVDHIIPWVLVGDELKDNYQALCETCNESKSSRTDYMISKLLKIV